MSGILALWNLDGRPADPGLLRALNDRMAHRGPDGAGLWRHGSVALGHRMLWTTPESLGERQPLYDEPAAVCLTFDGRVDNRRELRANLEGKGSTLYTGTDAELVIRAYECWGEDCPRHILGDFAFAIWDGRKQQLFCARDHVGVKPLYYIADRHFFLCSSELPPLLQHPAVRCEPNEGMVGEYLAGSITSQEETLYHGIYRLPPAHTLTVRLEGIRKARYWDVDLLKEIRYRDDRAYAEHFLHLFREAVLCRLRAHGPVGAELSGGLDSSSVIGMAQVLFREGAAPDEGFQTFSLVFPGMDCDESDYIQAVARMWNIAPFTATPDARHVLDAVQHIRQNRDFPDYPNYSMFTPLLHAQRERGMRVSLTGIGGDDWLGGGFPPYADLLCEGRWRELGREIRQDLIEGDFVTVLKGTLAPLLPRSAHRAYAWLYHGDGIPPWIDAGLARRVNLAERLRQRPKTRAFANHARQDRFLHYRSGEQVHSNEMAERASCRFGVESRHPFHDRRFMEFAFALPHDLRRRGEHRKFVLRHATRGILPDPIRQRLTKGEFSHTYAQAFASLGGEGFFSKLRTNTWVNEAQARRLYLRMADRCAQGDADYKPLTLPLWMIVGIEAWFTTCFDSVRLPSEQKSSDA